jgi:hypothetical protein
MAALFLLRAAFFGEAATMREIKLFLALDLASGASDAAPVVRRTHVREAYGRSRRGVFQ